MSEIEKKGKKKSNSDVKWEEMTAFEKFTAIILGIAVLLFIFLVILIIFGGVFGKSSGYPEVYAKNYKEDWPFGSHEQGRLYCLTGVYKGVYRPLVLMSLDKEAYALNDNARKAKIVGKPAYPDGHQFMREARLSAQSGMRNTINALIKEATEKGGCASLIGYPATSCNTYTDEQDTPCTPLYRAYKEVEENRRKLYQ